MMLNELLSSKRFSKQFLRSLTQLFLGSLEIKDIGLSAVGTTVFLGVFASQRYIKLFSTFVAANRLCDREVPFHKGLTTIRRKSVSPISAFTQEGVPIKRKHEFVIIRPGRSEQAEIAGSNPAINAFAPL